MTNTRNFQSSIDVLSLQYSRFTVSRTVNNPRNTLIELQIPAELPLVYSVEVSLYSLATNDLIYNFNIRSDTPSIFFSQTLNYDEQLNQPRTRRLLFIDFSKLDLSDYVVDAIPDGELNAVFNFFTEEVGSYEDRKLYVTQISDSRREVELQLSPEFSSSEEVAKLLESSRPQINSAHVINAVKQMFGQVAANIPSDNTVFSRDLVTNADSFPEGVVSSSIIQIQNITSQILTASYGMVTQSIQTQLNSGKKRFTDIYLRDLIVDKISEAYEAQIENQTFTQFTLV